jgi:hypothetical protein
MLRRLLVGLILGALVGGLVAAGLVAGLHLPVFVGTEGAALAYLTAAGTGVLTGLVAGKPIWATGAKIEAGLKAFFGALLAAGLMFALRQWGGALGDVPGFALDAAKATGPVAFGDFPAIALPLVAAVLGGFFELDNTGETASDDGKKASAPKKRVATEGTNGAARVSASAESDDEEAQVPAPVAPKRAKR